ncbi:MAG: hypothetical protein ACK45R_06825, partial [Candidatus Kapaibacterium sp.]
VSRLFRVMKTLLTALVLFLVATCVDVRAQFDFTPDSLITTTMTFQKPFATVYKTVLSCIKNKGCAIESKPSSVDDNGLNKANIRSEACVIVVGEDSTRDVMLKYGKVPMIRGGVWEAGRIQYNFALRELPEKQGVQVVMTVELSGNESYITHEVHFWNSNGILDAEMEQMIKDAIANPPQKAK